MGNKDFKKIIDAAAAKAKADADAATKDELEKIEAQADKLAGIFNDLETTDPATYKQLIEVVEAATQRNESVAAVVDRLKALGKVGMKLAESVGDLTTGGALRAVLTVLKS